MIFFLVIILVVVLLVIALSVLYYVWENDDLLRSLIFMYQATPFQPHRPYSLPYKCHLMTSASDVESCLCYQPGRGPSRNVVLFFHGNAGNILHHSSYLTQLSFFANDSDVVVFDYGIPTATEFVKPALKVFDSLLTLGYQKVYVIGHSLGGHGVLRFLNELSTTTISQHIKQIVLINTFSRIQHVVQNITGEFLFQLLLANCETVKQLDSIACLQKLIDTNKISFSSPKIHLIYTQKDSLIPPKENSVLLHQMFPQHTRLTCLERGDHNNFSLSDV
jgi:hypothetical protein